MRFAIIYEAQRANMTNFHLFWLSHFTIKYLPFSPAF